MVRKWSYLTPTTTLSNLPVVDRVSSLYNFKVFRKTTRFKRYNKGVTVMVRRKYSRRKHRTNWLIMSYITAAWATHYLKARQFERFYNSLGYFKSSAFATSTHVFLLKTQSMSSRQGVSASSCSTKILQRTIHLHTNYNPYLHNFTKHTNNNVIHALDNSSLMSASPEVFPNVAIYDESLYSYNEVEERQQLCSAIATSQLNLTLESSIQWVNAARQILILITLLNAHSK